MNSPEPFLLIPVGKDYLWGGTRLKTEYGKGFLDMEPLAETWECSTHPDGSSIVGSGPFKGQTLSNLLLAHPEYVGSHPKVSAGQIPILIKLIDAKKDLSVQVHPSDDYAWNHEHHSLGKTEMWYVLDAAPSASLIYGVKRELTREQVISAANQGTLATYLNQVPVKTGDAFFIEAGTIHAIQAGIVVAEIQENSNLTYRIYDYDRVGKDGKKRPLHLDKALNVARLTPSDKNPRILKTRIYSPGAMRENISRCKYFSVESYKVASQSTIPEDHLSFQVLLCIAGNAIVQIQDDAVVKLKKGNACFIPAGCRNLTVNGTCSFLRIKA